MKAFAIYLWTKGNGSPETLKIYLCHMLINVERIVGEIWVDCIEMGEGEVHLQDSFSLYLSSASAPAVDEKVLFSLAILTLTWFLCSNNNRPTTMDLSYDQHADNYHVRWWWLLKMPNGFYMQNPFKHFPFLDTSIGKFSDEHFSILGKLKLQAEVYVCRFAALSLCRFVSLSLLLLLLFALSLLLVFLTASVQEPRKQYSKLCRQHFVPLSCKLSVDCYLCPLVHCPLSVVIIVLAALNIIS